MFFTGNAAAVLVMPVVPSAGHAELVHGKELKNKITSH